MSILIISEVHKDRVRLAYLLSKMDITDFAHFETVGAAVLGVAEEEKSAIDVILLDIHCTKANREDVYGKISFLHEWTSAPILLVTTYDKREIMEGALFAGVFDFVLKPIDFTYFQTRVHIALKYNHQSRQKKEQEDNLKKDLLIAKNVQKSALTPALHTSKIQLDGFYITSNTLGGDMYCWFPVSEDSTAVILYDVMGHGIAASLITMSIRSLLRGMMTRLADPTLVVHELNRHIHELFKDEYMDNYLVTAIYLLIDTKEKKISYVNAAHPTAFMIGEDGQRIALTANTPILGLFPQMNIQKQEIKWTGRQRIILYTDGLQQNNEQVRSQHFANYIEDENKIDLQRFVADNQLEEIHQPDDVSIVFITTT